MDYKIEYNNLIRGIIMLQSDNERNTVIQNWIAKYCPKLKWINSELTRMDLLDFIKNTTDYHLRKDKKTQERYIAWLESKQCDLPEWYKDDEAMMQKIISMLESKDGTTKTCEDINAAISWLHQVRNRHVEAVSEKEDKEEE